MTVPLQTLITDTHSNGQTDGQMDATKYIVSLIQGSNFYDSHYMSIPKPIKCAAVKILQNDLIPP